MQRFDCPKWKTENLWRSIDDPLTLHWRSIEAPLTIIFGWGNDQQPAYTQLSFGTNRKHVIDFWYFVSNYFHIHREALWLLDYWSICMQIMWVTDDVALSCFCHFGRQLAVCRSFHQLLINIARLPHLSSSSSSSSISMTYQMQFPTILTMCTRSALSILRLDKCTNTAWQSSSRHIPIEYWPILLWLVWHHTRKLC